MSKKQTNAVANAVAATLPVPEVKAPQFGQERETFAVVKSTAAAAIRATEKANNSWQPVYQATVAHFESTEAFDALFGARGAGKSDRTVAQSLARAAFVAEVIAPALPAALRDANARILERKGSKVFESYSAKEKADWQMCTDLKADYRARCGVYFERIRDGAFPKPKAEKVTQPASAPDKTAAEVAAESVPVLTKVARLIVDAQRALQKATGDELGTLDCVVAVKHLNKLLAMLGAAGVPASVFDEPGMPTPLADTTAQQTTDSTRGVLQ